MDEAAHKRKLVAEIKALSGGQARRIEDRWAVGVLDLILKLPGLPLVVAEGKIFDGNLFMPTEKQFEEGQRWINAGVPALLIGWKGKTKEMFVSPMARRVDIKDGCFGSSWKDKHYYEILRIYMQNHHA